MFRKAYALSILSAVTIIHAYWGLSALIWPETLLVTALHPLITVIVHPLWVSFALIIAAVCAAISVLSRYDGHPIGYALLLPQQFIMWVSMLGGILIIASGEYPDGYVPQDHAVAFIASDQIGYVAISLVHTLTIISRYSISLGVTAWIRR